MSGDGLSPGCGLTLISERVSLIPKRNTQQYLQTYIKNQRRFSGNYTLDVGHAVDGCVLAEYRRAYEPQDPGKFKDLAFGTPVLKPRVSVPPNAKPTDNTKKACELPSSKSLGHDSKLQDSTVKEAEVANKRKRIHSSIQEEDSCQDVENVHKKPEKRCVHIGAGTKEDKVKINDDHAKRLEERRKRRKSKKEIMQPPTTKDLSEENQERSPKKKNMRKQTKDTQIGFALMHGFAATNIGKNRLTLESISRDVGVFQKGKASRKASVSNKHQKDQGRDRYCFSEAKFLNSKSSRAKESYVSSSSSTLSDDETISSCKKHVDLKKSSATKNSTKKKDVQEVLKSPVPNVRDRLPYNPAESIVWHIEKDSNMILESDFNNEPRSILIRCPSDFVKTAPKPKAPCRTRNDADTSTTPPTMFKDPGRTSSPSGSQSLAPSQSASQVAQKVQTRKGSPEVTGGLSKYFMKNVGDTSVPDRLVLDPPAAKLKEIMADLPSPECHSSTSLRIAAAHPDSREDPQYMDFILEENNLTGVRDDPMQDQQGYQPSEVLESSSAPMVIIHNNNLGSGPSECYVLSTSPDDPRDETLSMYCSSPMLWYPSNIDDYSLDAEHNDLTRESLQDHYVFSTDVSDVDWKLIVPGEDHLTDVDHDHSPDTYLDGRTCQSDSLLGLFQSPDSLDPDLGQDVLSQWECTGEDRLMLSHDVMPYSNDHYPQGDQDIGLPEIDLCSVEQHSECSLTGSYLQDEASVLGDNFCQGRYLLRSYNSGLPTKFSNAEAEVAGLLKGCHWLPQRF